MQSVLPQFFLRLIRRIVQDRLRIIVSNFIAPIRPPLRRRRIDLGASIGFGFGRPSADGFLPKLWS